ncbi:hypothetical protein QBC98_003443 [Kitasatospora acidiphila]
MIRFGSSAALDAERHLASLADLEALAVAAVAATV